MVLVGHPDDLSDLLAGALDAVVDQDAVVLVRRQQAVAVLVRSLQHCEDMLGSFERTVMSRSVCTLKAARSDSCCRLSFDFRTIIDTAPDLAPDMAGCFLLVVMRATEGSF